MRHHASRVVFGGKRSPRRYDAPIARSPRCQSASLIVRSENPLITPDIARELSTTVGAIGR